MFWCLICRCEGDMPEGTRMVLSALTDEQLALAEELAAPGVLVRWISIGVSGTSPPPPRTLAMRSRTVAPRTRGGRARRRRLTVRSADARRARGASCAARGIPLARCRHQSAPPQSSAPASPGSRCCARWSTGAIGLEVGAELNGRWTQHGNATSRVNSSEPSYRRLPDRVRPNHSHHHEIFEDVAELARVERRRAARPNARLAARGRGGRAGGRVGARAGARGRAVRGARRAVSRAPHLDRPGGGGWVVRRRHAPRLPERARHGRALRDVAARARRAARLELVGRATRLRRDGRRGVPRPPRSRDAGARVCGRARRRDARRGAAGAPRRDRGLVRITDASVACEVARVLGVVCALFQNAAVL